MKFLHYFGKFLISVGIGILLFVVWTLKGTDIYANNQQHRLEKEFAALPTVIPRDPGERKGNEEPVLLPPKDYSPEPGDPVFRLHIPDIDVRKVVVEGVDTESLRKGPGHYPSCRSGFAKPLCTEFDEVFPGEEGRVVVSGHRTTYGAPFWGLDRLETGDLVEVETKWGHFTYEVTEKKIVKPDSLAITVQTGKAEIVLTTCNPRFSAAERLVVFAELTDSEPA